MQTLTGNAYAKINLTLNVTGVRDDGYHELETVMHTVSLCDRIVVRRSQQTGVTLGCNLPYVPRDGRNLAVKAAEAFFAAAGIEGEGLEIHMKKSIPVGAGMAGGSTDAAAVLRLLNKMYGNPLPDGRLSELALSLGADVPFCMRGGAALARGVGEQLSPAPCLPDCWLVICKPPVSVSTKRAYALLDQCPRLTHPQSAPMLDALEQKDLRAVCEALGNSFQAPIEAERPIIGEARRALMENGAMGALMSGSGSSVFGVFRCEKHARKAAGTLKRRYRETFVARPVAHI